MIEAIKIFFIDNFSSVVWLAILILSMLPITEARFAIPFALASEIWGEKTLSPFLVGLICFLGGLIVTSVLLLSLKPIFKWLKSKEKMKKFIEKVESTYHGKVKKVESESESNFVKCFVLYSFVALPVPFTGVWTGSLIASLTKLGFWKTLITISIGNLTAICLLILICTVFSNSSLIVLIAFLVLLLVFAFYKIVMMINKKVKLKKETEKSN